MVFLVIAFTKLGTRSSYFSHAPGIDHLLCGSLLQILASGTDDEKATRDMALVNPIKVSVYSRSGNKKGSLESWGIVGNNYGLPCCRVELKLEGLYKGLGFKMMVQYGQCFWPW
ncbi:hypothetical protein HanIR_Chr17g0862871 [Helianthus annuus]|nr:hypothetical protein HanIR_Chr17g0862871 [Helianthus annuus]